MADRWPRKGETMTFLGKNGYDFQREAAMKAFTIGTSYTVKKCEVESWSHSIEFEEVPGSWNGVMFSLDGLETTVLLTESVDVPDEIVLTIPQNVMAALGLQSGDDLKWVIEGDRAILEKAR